MKKTLLALILAALPGLGHAQSTQSGVTLFGMMGGGVRWENGVKGGSQFGFDDNVVSVNLVGLKGREDLGGNVDAIFALAGALDLGTGALGMPGTLFSQVAYVGVSSPYGRLTLGRQFNAAEDLGIMLDPIGGLGSLTTEPAGPYLGNYFTGDSRFNNTIKYLGEAGGLRFAASYSPGGVAGVLRAGTDVAVAGMYRYRGASVGVSWGRTYSPDGAQFAQTLLGGGSLQLGPVRLYLADAIFEATANPSQPAAATRRDNIQLAGFVWRATPLLQVTGAFYNDIGGNLGNLAGADGHKITSYLSVGYFLSKRTELYAEVDRNGFTGAYRMDPVSVAGLGLRPGGGGVTGASAGVITRF